MRKPLPGHLAFREAVKNKTNKNEKKKNSNLSITVFNAADRNRTGTGITTHGILSPGRLPVPPLRHSFLRSSMDGGGFEPPKQVAADLQSVPFGHSGIHPCHISLTVMNDTTTQNKMQALFQIFSKNFQFVFFIDTQTVLCKFEHEEIIVY